MKPAFLIPALLLLGIPARADNPVIVHEWGTFTCLQDEHGNAIGGINVDDEPVPNFVYWASWATAKTAPQYTSDPTAFGGNLGLPPYAAGKCGGVPGDAHVTMRLETPVIYIYPPKGEAAAAVPPLDVHVDFHGGVLGEYYPHAEFSGLPTLKFTGDQAPMNGKFPYVDKEGITAKTTTSLDWKGVRVGSNEKPVETKNTTWTTPRETAALTLEVKWSDADFNDPKKVNQRSEAEHFLFYRGVGHLDSPLTAKADEAGNVFIDAKRGSDKLAKIAGDSEYLASWLVRIEPNGTCAYRAYGPFDERARMHSVPAVARMAPFSESDLTAGNLAMLKESMQEELVKAGLYPDEASAMLRTWELSYFKSPGLRFFYIAPRAWVDAVLPLSVAGAPTQVTRVMVGRIELIGDAQRTILARLAAGPCPDIATVKRAAFVAIDKGKLSDDQKWDFYRGARPISDLGIAIPSLVRDYLSLGRFRDALIVHEQQEHPSAALAQFIKVNGLVPQPSDF